MAEEIDKEEQRGYDNAMKVLERGNPQGCYDVSTRALNQNAFDRGWQKACIEKGAKPTMENNEIQNNKG